MKSSNTTNGTSPRIVPKKYAVIVGSLLLPLAGFSQAVPASASGSISPDEQEVVVLNPFTVTTEKDNGYQAASTISATALSTPMKESSAIVSVLTKDFLDDISATTIDDAAAWAPNTYFLNDAEKGDEALTSFNPNAVMRGINGQANLARDYFITNAPLDPATIERIEQPRGPNAALFGAAPQVGMVNVNAKKALLQRNFNRVSIRTDDNGSLRSMLDMNFGRDRLAFRVNAMNEKAEGWRNGDEQKNKLLMLSGTWQVDRSTTLRAEAMWDNRSGSFPPPNLYENVANWDGTTVVTKALTANPAASTGVTRLAGANDYLLFDSVTNYGTLMNWKGFGKTTGYNLAMYPGAELASELRPGLISVPVLPSREFDFNAKKSSMSDKATRLFGASLEHVFFGKLAAQVAWNYTYTNVYKWQFSFSTVNLDVNQVRPDGTTNPHFGELYTDNAYKRDSIDQYSRDIRMLLSYPFKWGFMEQRLVLMGGTRSEARNQDRFVLVRTNGTNTQVNATVNYVYFRRYASDGSSDLPFLGTGTNAGYNLDLMPWNFVYSRTKTKYWQAALAGRYWDGKVTTSVGWRHDYVSSASIVRDSQTLVTDTDFMSRFHWADPQKSRPDSLTYGAVYFPVPWLGVFANYSEGYNLQGVRPNLFGELWGTPKYEGTDVGLKIELLDGRISGTVSHYTSKRTGVDPQAASPQNNFGQLWIDTVNGYNTLATKATAAGDATLAAQYTASANAAQAEKDKIVGTAYDSRDLEANGWEFDLTANLTKNWRALVNFGLPETKQSNASPISTAYYAAHRAEWESHLTDTANFNTSDMTNQLSVIETAFRSQADGAAVSGTPDYTANLYSTYRIPSGRLKGLRFGGGVQFQGPRIIGVPVIFTPTSATAGTFTSPDLLATIKSQSTHLITAMVSYDLKLFGRTVKMQLNVSNLLGDSDLIYTNMATYVVPGTTTASGYQVPNRFRYINPRTFTLSCNVDL